MIKLCRLAPGGDLETTIEHLAAQMWSSRRVDGMDPPWPDAGEYWQRQSAILPRSRSRLYAEAMDEKPAPLAYRQRIMLDVLNAVVRAGGDDDTADTDEHVIEIAAAVHGMCDAIAVLVAASKVDTTPKDRRDTADLCRRHVLTAANGIAAKLAAGEELPWTLRPLGRLN